MPKKRFFIISAAVAALLVCGMIPVSVLEVKEGKSGEILFHKRAVEGDAFLFSYTHSVEKTPVEGTFLVEKGGGLRIVETRFASYGAGLPNEPGKTLQKNGWFIAEGGGRLDKLTFLFSPVNRPALKFKGREIALGNEKGEGGRIEIAIRHYPFLLYVVKSLYNLRMIQREAEYPPMREEQIGHERNKISR